jgi:hypothetical protein
MKPRYVFRLLVELAFFCLMIGPAAKAASIGVDVEVVAPTRAKAERQAIEDAINEVLPRYLGDVALNEEVQAFFSRKLDAIAGRNYRPLQKKLAAYRRCQGQEWVPARGQDAVRSGRLEELGGRMY